MSIEDRKNIFHNFSTQSFYAYLFLQKPNIDLIQALEYVDNVVRQIHTVRNNADEEFSKYFDELQRKWNYLGFKIKMPRITKRQTYRQNTPSNNAQDYLKFL